MGGQWLLDQDPYESYDDYSDSYEEDIEDDNDYLDDTEYAYINSPSYHSGISHRYTPTIGSILVGVKYAGWSNEIFYYSCMDTTVKEEDTVRVDTPDGIRDLKVVKKRLPNMSTLPDPYYLRGTIIKVVSRGTSASAQVKPKAVLKKYMYVGVRYSGSNKIYHFICDDWTVQIGDIVRVTSRRGYENVAVVCKEAYDAYSAPYPLEKTKHVNTIVARNSNNTKKELEQSDSPAPQQVIEDMTEDNSRNEQRTWKTWAIFILVTFSFVFLLFLYYSYLL